MDELDLVRLARPPVDDLGDDALARLRAAALGAAVDPPATDAEPVLELAEVAPVEVSPAAVVPTRRRWRLAAAGLAAAVLAGGGLAIANRRADDGGAATSTDVALRRQLSGQWTSTWQNPSAPGDGANVLQWGGLLLTFGPGDDGAVALDGPCGTFVARGYDVVGGALVLGEQLTSPERGCIDPTINEAVLEWLRRLDNQPGLRFDDCGPDGPAGTAGGCQELRFAGSEVPFTRQRSSDPPGPPTGTTVAGNHTPTLAELEGREYDLVTLVDAGAPAALPRRVLVTFGLLLKTTAGDCVAQAGVNIVDGRLIVMGYAPLSPSTGPMAADCPPNDALGRLLLAEPTIMTDGATLTLTAAGLSAVLRESASTTDPPPDAAHVPTIDELRGRTFAFVVIRKDARAIPAGAGVTIRFGDALEVGLLCNSGLGERPTIDDGRLTLASWQQTGNECADANDVVALLNALPRITLAGSSMLLTASDRDAELREVIDGTVAPTTSIGLAPPSTFTPPTTPAPPTTLTAVPATLDALAGRPFQGLGPAGDVRFRIEADGSLAVSYGCNGGNGRAAVTDGRLVATELSITEMACGTGFDLEEPVVDLFRNRPMLTLEGTTLVIAGAALTLRLEEQFERPLTNTRWITSGFVTPQYTGYAGLQQELTFSPTGRWTYQGRCGTLTGSYQRGDGTIAFRLDPQLSTWTCEPTAGGEIEEPNLRLLFQTTVSYAITERNLRLIGSDGTGEIFRSAE